jgi:hypothetical protein
MRQQSHAVPSPSIRPGLKNGHSRARRRQRPRSQLEAQLARSLQYVEQGEVVVRSRRNPDSAVTNMTTRSATTNPAQHRDEGTRQKPPGSIIRPSACSIPRRRRQHPPPGRYLSPDTPHRHRAVNVDNPPYTPRVIRRRIHRLLSGRRAVATFQPGPNDQLGVRRRGRLRRGPPRPQPGRQTPPKIRSPGRPHRGLRLVNARLTACLSRKRNFPRGQRAGLGNGRGKGRGRCAGSPWSAPSRKSTWPRH